MLSLVNVASLVVTGHSVHLPFLKTSHDSGPALPDVAKQGGRSAPITGRECSVIPS